MSGPFAPALLRLALGVFASAGTALLIVACSKSEEIAFDIEAGYAPVTLMEFARQAKVEIVYDAESVSGIRTNAVRGSLAPRAAIEKMLEGTSLMVEEHRKSGALAVLRQRSSSAGGGAVPKVNDLEGGGSGGSEFWHACGAHSPFGQRSRAKRLHGKATMAAIGPTDACVNIAFRLER